MLLPLQKCINNSVRIEIIGHADYDRDPGISKFRVNFKRVLLRRNQIVLGNPRSMRLDKFNMGFGIN